MTRSYQRILVTGARGFLGHHIVSALRKAGYTQIIEVGRKEYDLLEPGAAEQMIEDTTPDAVIHLAARVGGIIANRNYPADFYYDNITINTQTFQAAYKAKVKKLLTFMGACSYPATARTPIGEQQMWDGIPAFESAPYSLAKRMLLVQSEAYRRQHGFHSIVLIPGNVYGEQDNFNRDDAHVIPAMILRFIEARDNREPAVTCYGSGRPTRDFVYAGDVAGVVPWFLEHYDSSEPVNISTGTRTRIRELAEQTARTVGYRGEIRWDTRMPDGHMDKILDVSRLKELGLSCNTPLEEGLRKTVTWYEQARTEGTVRL